MLAGETKFQEGRRKSRPFAKRTLFFELFEKQT